MKDEIISHLDDPGQLEKLYRTNKASFKKAFGTIYPDLTSNSLANFWHERLRYESDELNWGTGRELVVIIVAVLVAGGIARLPLMLGIDHDFFYPRNIGFIVFPALSAYFAWKNKLSTGQVSLIVGLTLASALFINVLPNDKKSDTLVLSCIHLTLFLWSVLGFAFVSGRGNMATKRLDYLRYNGDLIIMTGLILIAGGIMTAVTAGLFGLIGIDIKQFYFENIVVFGLPAAPIVGTYLTQINPQLVGKVSPVLAKLFSPLVLVMLIVYLVAIVYSGKDPYNDREFLLLFNALLIGVLAIIFFSIAETAKATKNRPDVWVLLLLSIVTIIVNGIALSAILFRISAWGITPNRVAVLVSNVLILINLLLVALQLLRALARKENLAGVEKSIARYLPLYAIWAVIVTFLFPFFFGFR